MDTHTHTRIDEPAALRTADILHLLSCSRSTFYLMLAAGDFPPADFFIGRGGKRWTRASYDAWLAARSGGAPRGRPRGTP